jgi:2-haloacid dehalogenase
LLEAVAAIGAAAPALAAVRSPLRAVAFDAFVLFDPMLITARARETVGSRGADLVAAASAKLFAYSWLYTTAGHYEEFERLADAAFRFAAASLAIPLSDRDRAVLLRAYSELETWPDVAPALDTLRSAGIRLALLSNLPRAALAANLRRGGIDRRFDFVLSTDLVRQYKPAPAAYALAADSFRLPRAAIGFAASAAWDAAGAAWFGYPTVWVNRSGSPIETIGRAPSLIGSGMGSVLRLTNETCAGDLTCG